MGILCNEHLHVIAGTVEREIRRPAHRDMLTFYTPLGNTLQLSKTQHKNSHFRGAVPHTNVHGDRQDRGPP